MAASKAVRLGPYLKELRIHLCQKSSESKGIREFVEKHYVPLKKSNPDFPILIRECSGIQPRLFARYEFGKETNVPLSNFNSEQVLKTITELAVKK